MAHPFSQLVRLIWLSKRETRGGGGEGEEGWSGVSWDEAHLPYGCGAAPYLGSAKRGAGLPFPVASFLCALDPVKKKKEKNHLNYTIHRFVPNDRKRASKQAKLFFWNRSIDRHRRRDLLLLVSRSFFFLPSPPPPLFLGFHLYIEIVYGTERTGHRLFYSGVYRDWPRRNLFRRAELREIQSTNWIGFPLDWGRATVERILNKLAKLTDGRRGPD